MALDVARATRREGALDALLDYLRDCLHEVEPDLAQPLNEALTRAAALMRTVAGQEGSPEPHETRRATTALYGATSGVFLAWEAAQLSQGAAAQDRTRLARLVLSEKLAARGPLAPAMPEPDWLHDLLLRAGGAEEPSSPRTGDPTP